MIQQQHARVIETLQEQLREVMKGFAAGGILTGGPPSKTGNTAGLFGQAPMEMIDNTRGGPSPAVPQPRSWQATEPIPFTRRTPMGVREGNPQEGQSAPLPVTPSVDRRRIQEWGARVQRAELREYVRPEGGRYALEDEHLPHTFQITRDEVPPTRYDPDQPWYYDPRQGWHRKAAPRPPNEGRNTWESNEEKNQITIELKLDVGKIESFAGDDRSAWKTWVLSLERMFGVRPTIYAREKDKCTSAASHLTGAALSHSDTLNRQRLRGKYTCLEDWTEFKREFGSKFRPIDEADEARRRLA
ncbi:hypothetical protein F5051DRAFT_446316 [Lentinula edodes]|nr:hypothetical protein F5051DRAFT_446316 [Lentinula edodes]